MPYAGVGIVEAKPPFSAARQTVHLGRIEFQGTVEESW